MLRRLTVILALLTMPEIAASETVGRIVDNHILPRYHALTQASSALAETTLEHCAPHDDVLRKAYHEAFDTWVRVSHIRFGPSEVDDRAFALTFWPDTKGRTPRVLSGLILSSDPSVHSIEDFSTISIAGRGFYALEFMLYDPIISTIGSQDYRCALVRAIAADIAAIAGAIFAEWKDTHEDLMRRAGSNETYQSSGDALSKAFTSLATGLQFTSEVRLGRPLGTFDRPRPKRSEARRSGRSLRHVILSLEATNDLAAIISNNDHGLASAFARALEQARQLDDPVFEGVIVPQSRLKIEIVQQSVDLVRQMLETDIGPRLGLGVGFNLLDGD